jgi:hypothetical protein
LRSLKPRHIKYDVHDPADTNLLLRISPDGRKSWMVRYKSAAGDMRQRPIGKYPMMPIDGRLSVAIKLQKVTHKCRMHPLDAEDGSHPTASQ